MGLDGVLNTDELYVLNGSSFSEKESFASSVLTPAELALLPEPQDKACFALTRKLYLFDHQRFINLTHFEPVKGASHYVRTAFKEWKPTFAYFLGERLHHSPSVHELAEAMKKDHLWEQYRVFFALRFPGEVEDLSTYSCAA